MCKEGRHTISVQEGRHTISVQEGRLANPSAIPSVYTIRLCGLISDHIRGNSSSTYLLNLILLHQ